MARAPLVGKRALSALKLLGVNLLVLGIAIELASIVLVHLKKWPGDCPTYHLGRYDSGL